MENSSRNMVNYSNKKGLFLAILIVFLMGYVCYFTGVFPIVVFDDIEKDDTPTVYSNEPSQTSTTVNVLENIEFDKVILLIDYGDYDDCVRLPKAIPHRKVHICTDTKLLNTLKRSSWCYTGGDMCTISSKILFIDNNHIVNSYYILLSESQVCMQSCETGLIEAVQKDELLTLFSGFKPYRGLVLHVK